MPLFTEPVSKLRLRVPAELPIPLPNDTRALSGDDPLEMGLENITLKSASEKNIDKLRVCVWLYTGDCVCVSFT